MNPKNTKNNHRIKKEQKKDQEGETETKIPGKMKKKTKNKQNKIKQKKLIYHRFQKTTQKNRQINEFPKKTNEKE